MTDVTKEEDLIGMLYEAMDPQYTCISSRASSKTCFIMGRYPTAIFPFS